MTRAGARGPSRAFARTLLVAAFVASAGGCRRSGPDVAELIEAQGTVDREHEGAWASAPGGAHFVVGDAIRTGKDASSARLLVRPSSRLRLGAEALLRFRGAADGKQAALRFETGAAEIEGDAPVLVDTRAGVARAEPGTKLRVRASGEGVQLEVVVGRAALLTPTGEIAINQGEGLRATGAGPPERYTLAVGHAELEPARAAGGAGGAAGSGAGGAPGAATAEAAPTHPATSHAGPDASAEREPAEVVAEGDVDVPAGESATLHVLRAPVAVRFSLGSLPCDGPVTVDFGGRARPRHASGTEAVVTVLAAGSHRYEARCASGGTTVGGRVVVTRDAGTAAVAKQPPVNSVDADGRKYTIIYQGRPPALRVAWPGAPAQGPFELHLVTRGHEEVRRAARADVLVPSGSLSDGAHTLWFTAGDARSKDTSVAIAFQNAAVTAQIRAPAPGARWGAGPIAVAGVAVEGSRVMVDGVPVETDSAGRFAARVAPPAADRPLAVRIEHPKGGVHYYLRHRPR